MRTKWICAASISDRSASHRDSGHCSGYHAAPSNSEGEYGVEGTCAARGTDKEINKATQIATFLSMNVSSILVSINVSLVPAGEPEYVAGCRSHPGCPRDLFEFASSEPLIKSLLR